MKNQTILSSNKLQGVGLNLLKGTRGGKGRYYQKFERSDCTGMAQLGSGVLNENTKRGRIKGPLETGLIKGRDLGKANSGVFGFLKVILRRVREPRLS